MSKKKILEGYVNILWKDNFHWRYPIPETLTKQNVGLLAMPFITNPCTKYIDKRSHRKVKVRITIEEV